MVKQSSMAANLCAFLTLLLLVTGLSVKTQTLASFNPGANDFIRGFIHWGEWNESSWFDESSIGPSNLACACLYW